MVVKPLVVTDAQVWEDVLIVCGSLVQCFAWGTNSRENDREKVHPFKRAPVLKN